ncbi:cell division protein FtsN [Xenorhabdus ehlersii]|uniref:Cell division protein FtsN n=1 Tax=Xenorhabdus ehlersii TaxID=290111 RepID=A0A2D0IV12_9GAMM|nr:cell division protein FtsN [Xenorhabdus sp. TS4]PHM25716.1 cell division protein FtsN [Xenorhabdus ehlersii]RKE93296.1 cell division protein FtsN [Xenorhabdus ehlersii]
MSRGRSNPRRKSTGKKKNQAQGLPKTTLAVAVALVVMFIGGLYFIVHNKQAENKQGESAQNASQSHHQTKGQGLPPKPEERWSYIKELENRPVNESSIQEGDATVNKPLNHPPQLTPEQKQLLEQIQADMRQPPISLKEVPYNSEPVPRSRVINPPAQQQYTEQILPEQKSAAVPEKKPSTSSQTSTKSEVNETKLMLQCGSFRTMEQAESVRANLAFAGIESQITTKDNWNRVVLGPYKNKASAEKMRERVAGAGVPGCILRPTGG